MMSDDDIRQMAEDCGSIRKELCEEVEVDEEYAVYSRYCRQSISGIEPG